jgi:hypothetical protein
MNNVTICNWITSSSLESRSRFSWKAVEVKDAIESVSLSRVFRPTRIRMRLEKVGNDTNSIDELGAYWTKLFHSISLLDLNPRCNLGLVAFIGAFDIAFSFQNPSLTETALKVHWKVLDEVQLLRGCWVAWLATLTNRFHTFWALLSSFELWARVSRKIDHSGMGLGGP